MMVAIRHHARTANTDRISRTAAGWKPHIISAELAAFFSRLRSAGSTQRRHRCNPRNSGAVPVQKLSAKQLLLALYHEVSNDRVLAISAGVTFYALLAIFPAVAAMIAMPAFLKSVGWSDRLEVLIDIGRWPVVWAVIAFGIALLYRFGPSRNDIPWRWISWGSAFASFAWLAASLLFSWYAANFGTYNKTYGSLGAVIGFMTWIWISVIVILIGEELNEILDKPEMPEKKKGHSPPLGAPGKTNALGV